MYSYTTIETVKLMRFENRKVSFSKYSDYYL